MDGRRPDALTDQALDRELTAAFAVDHSPEFLARVRARVAEAPGPGSSWTLRAWMTACAAAIVVAVLFIGLSNRPAIDVPPTGASRGDVALAARPVVARPSVAPHVAPTPAPVVHAVARATSAAAPAEHVDAPAAEILISRDEQRVFQRFARALQAGELQPVATGIGAEITALSTTEIAIRPIVIAPLDDDARQGEGS
jgi:hypothetical protein